jgi:hypothetical protein
VSDTDSFIEEVTEEVKRDRLFKLLKRYGWIGVVVVLGIVGGTAFREYRVAQHAAAAQAFGDQILTALDGAEAADRAQALAGIGAEQAGAQAILQMLIAAEESEAQDTGAAVSRLEQVAQNAEIPTIYRQIASYKALTAGASTMDAQTRRAGFEALAVPGQPLRLLAEEQLALIDIETGAREAALERLDAISQDAEATAGLRRRASQLIVALGGTPITQ